MKQANQLEIIAKGFSHRYRINIVRYLAQQPEQSLADLAEKLNSEYKNVSVHLSKMVQAGLVMKRHVGVEVLHKLTERGRAVYQFLKRLE